MVKITCRSFICPIYGAIRDRLTCMEIDIGFKEVVFMRMHSPLNKKLPNYFITGQLLYLGFRYVYVVDLSS